MVRITNYATICKFSSGGFWKKNSHFVDYLPVGEVKGK
jgi:hypothetical protein